MKEIIKRLENMQLFITMQFEVEKGKKKQLELNKDFQALNIAISALEKQIPKKLKNIGNVGNVVYFGNCPHCNNQVSKTSSAVVCSHCGQALNWSDC